MLKVELVAAVASTLTCGAFSLICICVCVCVCVCFSLLSEFAGLDFFFFGVFSGFAYTYTHVTF